MKKNKSVLPHLPKKSILLKETCERFAEMHTHSALKDQRNLFSETMIHHGTKCRWTSPLKSLPYQHVIETNAFGEPFRVHLFIQHENKILTLERAQGSWNLLHYKKQIYIESLIPRRHFCNGWLRNPVKKSTLVELGKTPGLHHSEIPDLTEANALLLISLMKIQSALPLIRKLAENYQPIVQPFKIAA